MDEAEDADGTGAVSTPMRAFEASQSPGRVERNGRRGYIQHGQHHDAAPHSTHLCSAAAANCACMPAVTKTTLPLPSTAVETVPAATGLQAGPTGVPPSPCWTAWQLGPGRRHQRQATAAGTCRRRQLPQNTPTNQQGLQGLGAHSPVCVWVCEGEETIAREQSAVRSLCWGFWLTPTMRASVLANEAQNLAAFSATASGRPRANKRRDLRANRYC